MLLYETKTTKTGGTLLRQLFSRFKNLCSEIAVVSAYSRSTCRGSNHINGLFD